MRAQVWDDWVTFPRHHEETGKSLLFNAFIPVKYIVRVCQVG